MTTEDDEDDDEEEGEDNEASSLGSGRRGLVHMKTEVEVADRDVHDIISRKGSAKSRDDKIVDFTPTAT